MDRCLSRYLRMKKKMTVNDWNEALDRYGREFYTNYNAKIDSMRIRARKNYPLGWDDEHKNVRLKYLGWHYGESQKRLNRIKDKHYLYRHFDSNKELLYVGITNNLKKRHQQHSKSSSWFDERSYTIVEKYRSRYDVLNAENQAIKKEKPKHNKKGVLNETS